MSYASTQTELAEHVRVQLAIGHHDVDAIVEEAIEIFGVDEAAVRALVDAAVTAREGWPAVTDCDRLDAAFAELERSGIRARQHFACCASCGHYEISEDIYFARDVWEERVDGYVFYHRQDTETAVTRGLLHLRYATLGSDPAATTAIGHRVYAALQAAGLEVAWNGEPASTIQLRNLRWQRRGWPTPARRVADPVATWCAALERAAPSELVAALGEPVLVRAEPAVALRLARAVSTHSVVVWPRAAALAVLARRHADNALWREAALACAPTSDVILDIVREADLRDPDLREAIRLHIDAMRLGALRAAAMAWFHVRAATVDPDLGPAHYRLDSDENAPSAKLAIRAALWALGDDAQRAAVVTALDGPDGYHIEPYAVRAAAHAATLRGEPDAIAIPAAVADKTVAEAEAHLATVLEGYDDGLYTAGELEAARYELSLLRGDFAEIAARALDAQRAARAGVRAELEAIRDGAVPRAVVAGPPPPDTTLARHVGKWRAATTRGDRIRARRSAERVLEAAAAIAAVDHDRAAALVADVLTGETDMLDNGAVIGALLALGRLTDARARADDRPSGCAGLGPLITALALAGHIAEARARLAKLPIYLFAMSNVISVATATVAVADDRRAAAIAMLDAWERAEATIDALVPTKAA